MHKRIAQLKRSITSCMAVLVLGALLVPSAAVPAGAASGWGPDGVLVCGARGNDVAVQVTEDGNGGAIVTWMDARHDPSGNDPWIYAQRLDSSGNTLWQKNGVPICGAELITWPNVVPDSAGGAIVTWGDAREWPKWQVFAQRVDAAGNVLWKADGVTICDESGYGDFEGPRPRLAVDGNGGAIIAWPDYRRGVPDLPDIYAQRVAGNGSTLWADNGLRVSPLPDNHSQPLVCSDESGGAIVSFTGPNLSQLVQRIDGNGNPLWPEAGVQVLGPRPEDSLTQDMAMVPDGMGGALFNWSEDRNYRMQCYDVYCQRVNGAGQVLWKADGVPVLVVDRDDSGFAECTAVADGTGGGIITWVDRRAGEHNKLYAQRVDAAGKTRWRKNGTVVAGDNVDKIFPTIAADGQGGGIINWLDGNIDEPRFPRLQRVGSDGGLMWGLAGVRPCTTRVANEYCPMTSDAAGDVIMCWGDLRSGGEANIYAQKVSGPPPEATWYLAEGTNAWGFKTYISIQNPNDRDLTARLTYMDPSPPAAGNGIVGTRTVALPALSQTTVSSYADIGEVDFSTKVECLEYETIAVDRTMFWTGEGAATPGYHSSIGTSAPSTTWYLPEGSSAWGFETWTTVLNPNSMPADVTVTYMTEAGPIPVERTVPANSRATYAMASDMGAADASTLVESDVPVVAERSMYRGGRREGSCSIGAVAPANDFFLAEGATGYDVGFVTYVLVQNPNEETAEVALAYQTPSGEVQGPSFTMQPNTRRTVRLNDQLPPDINVSTRVHGSRPIVAERAMYWDNGSGEAFHASIGLDTPHLSFKLPDGQTSGGFETWTLIQNPNPAAVKVRVTYLPQGGGTPITFTSEIPRESRATFDMRDALPSGRASILVQSLDGARPVMCERAMYMGSRGAGSCTVGGFGD